jgi:hypothetical protein
VPMEDDDGVVCHARVPSLLLLVLLLLYILGLAGALLSSQAHAQDVLRDHFGLAPAQGHVVATQAAHRRGHAWNKLRAEQERIHAEDARSSLTGAAPPSSSSTGPPSSLAIALGPSFEPAAPFVMSSDPPLPLWSLSPPSTSVGPTASQTERGKHVPCEWIEARFGGLDKMQALRQAIATVRANTPPGGDVAANTTVLTAAGAFLSEHVQSRRLLDSVGIYCQAQTLRSRCLDPTAHIAASAQASSNDADRPLTAAEVRRLHAWYRTLPTIDVFDGAAQFNMLSGAIAALSCQSSKRYGSPFATPVAPSVYVQPKMELLPEQYVEFVEKRCASSTDPEPQVQVPAPLPVNVTEPTAVPTTPPNTPPQPPPWAAPLLPLLPSLCSLSSFTRPSLARRCLRHQRLIAFGDSTVQELVLQLIDFLESPDGEDDVDLTRMAPDFDPNQEWVASTATTASHDQHIYYFVHLWSPPDSCHHERTLAYAGRMFSTAYMPTPYLAAWNITVTMRWNPHQNPCGDMAGPDAPSSPELFRATYRLLRESCLPEDAVKVSTALRRKDDGTWRNAQEYIQHVNSKYPNGIVADVPLYSGERPRFGCTHPGYLTDEVVAQFTPAEWPLHLATVPLFDHALFNMGAHYARQWANIDAQRSNGLTYQWTPSQYHHAVEHALTMAQTFAWRVVVKEVAWRTPNSGGDTVPQLNQVLHEIVVAAQMQLYQQEVAQSTASIGGANPPPSRRRALSYLPTHELTTEMQKYDPDHCSFKNAGGGHGDGGMRSPYCYQIVQDWLRLMCAT